MNDQQLCRIHIPDSWSEENKWQRLLKGNFRLNNYRQGSDRSAHFFCVSPRDRRLGSSKPENRSRGPSTSRLGSSTNVLKCAKQIPEFGAGQILRPFFQSTRSIFCWHQEAATMGDGRMAWFCPTSFRTSGRFSAPLQKVKLLVWNQRPCSLPCGRQM